MVYPARLHVSKTFEKLVELLPTGEQTKVQILFLSGSQTPFRDDTDREMPFRQESNFYYLTGCEVPGSHVILTYQQGTSLSNDSGSTGSSQDLFIPAAVPADLMWSIPPPSLEAATQTHEATIVSHTDDLSAAIVKLTTAFPDAIIHTLPRDSPLFPTPKKEFLAAFGASAQVTDAYALSALHNARLIKTEQEITQIRKANQISSRAHEVVMRVLGKAVRGEIERGKGSGVERPLLPGEWLIEKEAEAEAIFVASCRREGAVHQAYLPIVASASHAATLHYCCNDKEFAYGPVDPHPHNHPLTNGTSKQLRPQVLLIDAGCEWTNYASDITRTMPVGNGGKFTFESRGIYDIVLEMQKVSIAALKPGVHWDTIQLLCHKTLVKGFQKLGIFYSPSSPNSGSWNSEEAILASGITAAFFPHGVGHSLGLDVHDVPSASKPGKNDSIASKSELVCEDFYKYLRLRLLLAENMVVTVEPGIYFHKHLLQPIRDSRHINHEVLKKYESVGGVRIEDVILITKDGCENLTTVGKETSWVEGVCSGSF